MIVLWAVFIVIMLLLIIRKNRKKDRLMTEEKPEFASCYFKMTGVKKQRYNQISSVQSAFPDNEVMMKRFMEAKESTKAFSLPVTDFLIFTEAEYLSLVELKKLDIFGNECSPPAFTGKKYSVSEERLDVWNIPVLMDVFFKADTEPEILTELYHLIYERLNIKVKALDEYYMGPLRKYLYLHISFQTEYRSRYDKPMYIELFGVVIHAGGKDKNIKMLGTGESERSLEEEIEGPIIIRILQANWSNISLPGIGVPFYF